MTNTVTVLAESTGFSAVNTIWVLLGAALCILYAGRLSQWLKRASPVRKKTQVT